MSEDVVERFERLRDDMPSLLVMGLDQIEALLNDEDVDAEAKIRAFKELRGLIKEATGSVTGTPVDVVAMHIEWKPEYLRKAVDFVWTALEWTDWRQKDQELAKRIVARWCGEQEKLAARVLDGEVVLTQEDERIERDDGFPWEWAVVGRPEGWKSEEEIG